MNKKDIAVSQGEIVIFKTADKRISLDVKLEQETVWLTQAQISKLFQVDRTGITRHIKNIFNSGELDEKSNVQKMHFPFSDKPIAVYNLDVIISLGYRVNSTRATQFRMWATNVLNKHLVNGYTLNEKRLKIAEHKYRELQKSLKLLSNVIHLETVSDETKGLIQIISHYSRALDILDDFDHGRLSAPRGTERSKYVLTYEDAKKIIAAMKARFKDSGLVGQEKDDSLQSSIGVLYQTFNGKELYLTVEEKAAHLLYFVTKNHSFVDGNKRIAAAIFICFLQKNSLLLREDHSQRIDDNTLVALTLMIAASKPLEKESMIKVILNLLH